MVEHSQVRRQRQHSGNALSAGNCRDDVLHLLDQFRIACGAGERKVDAMLQIFLIPRQRPKIGLIVFCALALMALLTTCRREVQLEQQSPQPEQSPQPQQSPEPQESPQPQKSPRPRQSPQPQQSQEPQQSEESQQPQEPQELHARAVVDVHAAMTLLEDYKSRNGAYPTTGQALEALGAARKDPWGGDYIYQFPSTRGRESYDFFSAGPDHIPDTADDDWGEE